MPLLRGTRRGTRRALLGAAGGGPSYLYRDQFTLPDMRLSRNSVAASSQYFSVADHADFSFTNALSVSGWYKPTTLAANHSLVRKWDTTTEWQVWCGSNGKLYFFVANGPADGGANYEITDAAHFTVGQWTHWEVTYDAGTVTIYINGSAVASTTNGSIASSLQDGAGALVIGGVATVFADGCQQGIRLIGEVLDASEVLADYNSGNFWSHADGEVPSALSAKDFRASYDAGEPSGNLIDSSGNSHDATATNAPLWNYGVGVSDLATTYPSGRTADVGTEYFQLDSTDDQQAISGGSLQILSGGSAAWDTNRFYGEAQDRLAGRSLYASFTVLEGVLNGTAFYLNIGFSAVSPPVISNITHQATLTYDGSLNTFGGPSVSTGFADDESGEIMIMLRDTGAFYFEKRTGDSDFSLVYIQDSGTPDPVYPAGNCYNGAVSIAEWYVQDLTLIQPLASDSFAGTNGTDLDGRALDGLGHADGNGQQLSVSWAAVSKSWDIQGNTGGQSESGAGYLVIDVSASDVCLKVTLGSIGGADTPGIVFRYTDTGNFWMARLDVGSNTFDLYDRTGGFTLVDQTAFTVTGTHVMKVVLNGTSIKAWMDDANLISGSSSTRQSVTTHGLVGGVDATTFDNFVCWATTGHTLS